MVELQMAGELKPPHLICDFFRGVRVPMQSDVLSYMYPQIRVPMLSDVVSFYMYSHSLSVCIADHTYDLESRDGGGGAGPGRPAAQKAIDKTTAGFAR
jgi:hypothetical protein